MSCSGRCSKAAILSVPSEVRATELRQYYPEHPYFRELNWILTCSPRFPEVRSQSHSTMTILSVTSLLCRTILNTTSFLRSQSHRTETILSGTSLLCKTELNTDLFSTFLRGQKSEPQYWNNIIRNILTFQNYIEYHLLPQKSEPHNWDNIIGNILTLQNWIKYWLVLHTPQKSEPQYCDNIIRNILTLKNYIEYRLVLHALQHDLKLLGRPW